MKWITLMLVTTLATLTASHQALGGSFNPATNAYTTDQITVTLTPKTVTASSAIIANGETVYWTGSNNTQRGGPFYWGPHTHTMGSAAIASTAASKINANGVCSATASGTSLTVSGCFSFMETYTLYMGKSASCRSMYHQSGNIGSGTSLLHFGNFVGLNINLGSTQRAYDLTNNPITSMTATSVVYPSQTRTPTNITSSTYSAAMTATLSAKTPPNVYFQCSAPQGVLVSRNNATLTAGSFTMLTTVNRPTYAPTITYSPALPLSNNTTVNIRNITAIEILPRTVFNTGAISSYRTTYVEQPLTVTGSGSISRNQGANANFDVLESWTCTVTGQINFRIMRNATNANVCSSTAYTHPVSTPQSLTAQWKAQSQASSGAWNATATVTFTLP